MPFDIVWRLSDKEALIRRLELLYGGEPDHRTIAKELCNRFLDAVSLHPVVWPPSSEPPSSYSWECGRVAVCYRLVPANNTIEVLSVGWSQEGLLSS